MRKNWWVAVTLLLVVPGLLLTASCAKKPAVKPTDAKPEAPATSVKDDGADKARQDELDRQKRAEEERLRAEAARKAAEAARSQFTYEDVYFDFDSSVLKSEAQMVLRRKADYLKGNPDLKVAIEGHCDERGTPEYNLALGDRRAQAAKKFLTDLGIADARLKAVSYGEEKPVDPRHTEEAWAKNRRAHFVLE